MYDGFFTFAADRRLHHSNPPSSALIRAFGWVADPPDPPVRQPSAGGRGAELQDLHGRFDPYKSPSSQAKTRLGPL